MRTKIICQNCNKEFYPLGGHLLQKTCSRKCGNELRIRNGGTKKGKHYPHLQRARIGKCIVCNKEFRAVDDFGDRKQKYCSVECYHIDWVKNIRPKMSDNPGVKGELNHSWKGDSVGYHGIHHWIANLLGRPTKCDICGTTTAKKFEWANKDHKYSRKKEDWMRVCTSCHRRYDYAKFIGKEDEWEKITPQIKQE